MRQRRILIAATIVLSGCANQTNPPEDKARVRYVATSDLYSHVYSFDKDGCEGEQHFITTIQKGGVDGEGDINNELLDMPSLEHDSKSVKEYELPALVQHFGAISTDGYTIKFGDSTAFSLGLRCATTFSFTPQPGRDYEIVHSVRLKEDDSDCGVRIYTLVEKEDGSFYRWPLRSLQVASGICAKVFD